jgi:hypothetical protein
VNTFDPKRVSPVTFPSQPLESEIRQGWEVILKYAGEGEGPFLVDLSHRPKWDLQDGNLDHVKPWGRHVPKDPGQSNWVDGLLINRMNWTQAAIWNLAAEDHEMPEEPAYTDVADGFCLLALVGAEALAVMERVSPLDLAQPGKIAPYLLQGPVMDIPSQLVMLETGDIMTVLVSFSRGYGQAMAEALLGAGSEYGLCPGGERQFQERLKAIANGKF